MAKDYWKKMKKEKIEGGLDVFRHEKKEKQEALKLLGEPKFKKGDKVTIVHVSKKWDGGEIRGVVDRKPTLDDVGMYDEKTPYRQYGIEPVSQKTSEGKLITRFVGGFVADESDLRAGWGKKHIKRTAKITKHIEQRRTASLLDMLQRKVI